MFARMTELKIKSERRNEFMKLANTEVRPLITRQPGFVDAFALTSDTDPTLATTVALWESRQNAERFYASEDFRRWMDRAGPFLREAPAITTYDVANSTHHRISAGRAA